MRAVELDGLLRAGAVLILVPVMSWAAAGQSTNWSTLSLQNCWHGVVLRGGTNFRIDPYDKTNSSCFDQQWAAQRRGTLITPNLKTSVNADSLRVWFSGERLSVPVKDGNWHFAETDGAWSAVNVVSEDTGFLQGAPGESGEKDEATKTGEGVELKRADDDSPAIIEIARKVDLPSLGAFRKSPWKLTFNFAADQPTPHPAAGQRFAPADVDWEHPVYENAFTDDDALQDWRLEGGKGMRVQKGRLVLESEPPNPTLSATSNHLVCWLAKEMPADFLLEFKVCPRDRNKGLNIVFFNARGLHGESIFEPTLMPRSGIFTQYHSGDLNNYHVSYWAGGRGTANVRKNKGFTLAATGPDLIAQAPADAFQTVRLYKRGGTIRLAVDDVISVAYDDDGKASGPVWTNPGWIGLRQMAHTVRCEYDDLKIYPCKN